MKLSIFNPKEKVDIAKDHQLFEIKDESDEKYRVETDLFAQKFQDIVEGQKTLIGRQTKIEKDSGKVMTVYEG